MVFYKARDKIRKLKFEERKESEDLPVNLAGVVSGFPVRSVTSNLNCQFGSIWDHHKNKNKQKTLLNMPIRAFSEWVH